MFDIDNEDNFCLECGKYIQRYGRQGRKFCSNECKNRYHNRARTVPWQRYQDRVIKILRFNYMILKNLYSAGIKTIGIRDMQRMGFRFEIFTSSSRKGRSERFYCFDLGYDMSGTKVQNIESLLKAGDEGKEEANSKAEKDSGAMRLSLSEDF